MGFDMISCICPSPAHDRPAPDGSREERPRLHPITASHV